MLKSASGLLSASYVNQGKRCAQAFRLRFCSPCTLKKTNVSRTSGQSQREQSRFFSRTYATELRTPEEANIYNEALPPSKWNYLYFLMPVACFGLGLWQYQRLEWKENLIRSRAEGLKVAPIPLDLTQDLDPVTYPKEMSWRPVSITGNWIHNLEILVGPRVYNSKGGYHVITPLQTPHGRILVNRGFVPSEKKDRMTRPESQKLGSVVVSGTLREISAKPSWVPQNDPEKKLWYWIDIPAMCLATHSEPYFLEELLDEANPTALPIGGQLHQPLTNNHLQYMMTWFSLSAILTGMSFMMIRRGRLPPTSRPAYVVPPKHRPKGTWFL